MVVYGIDIRPLAQIHPELWGEFVQLDAFLNTKPQGMIGLDILDENLLGDGLESDLETILKEVSKLMSISLGIAIDQLPRKYYDIGE